MRCAIDTVVALNKLVNISPLSIFDEIAGCFFSSFFNKGISRHIINKYNSTCYNGEGGDTVEQDIKPLDNGYMKTEVNLPTTQMRKR